MLFIIIGMVDETISELEGLD